MPVSALSAPLARQLGLRWRMGCATAPIRWLLATPFGEQDALRLASVSHPEYVGRVASFSARSALAGC